MLLLSYFVEIWSFLSIFFPWKLMKHRIRKISVFLEKWNGVLKFILTMYMNVLNSMYTRSEIANSITYHIWAKHLKHMSAKFTCNCLDYQWSPIFVIGPCLPVALTGHSVSKSPSRKSNSQNCDCYSQAQNKERQGL